MQAVLFSSVTQYCIALRTTLQELIGVKGMYGNMGDT